MAETAGSRFNEGSDRDEAGNIATAAMHMEMQQLLAGALSWLEESVAGA